jgi:hypothetical protein
MIVNRVKTKHKVLVPTPWVCGALALRISIVDEIGLDAVHLTLPEETLSHFRAHHFQYRDRYFGSLFFEAGMAASDFLFERSQNEGKRTLFSDLITRNDSRDDLLDEGYDSEESQSEDDVSTRERRKGFRDDFDEGEHNDEGEYDEEGEYYDKDGYE